MRPAGEPGSLRQAEEALRQSEKRYRLLIERLNEGFVATDGDNRLTLVNDKLLEMLGYSREELLGRDLADFVEPSQRAVVAEQERRRKLGAADPYPLRWVARDGGTVDTVVSPTPFRDLGDEGIESFAVITDVTERRRLEARVQQAQKLESLGLLAGGIAHDFNNLLVGILGNAGLALMELPEGSEIHATVRQIEMAAQRASELTQEMLAYSGRGRFVVERLDLSSLVEETVHLLGATISKKARLSIDFPPELPAVQGDPTQLRQVIMNLVTNASEAVAERQGAISVTAGCLEADRGYLAETFLDEDLAPGRYVYLEVSDTGGGMDEATQKRIFDPFFTTKRTGRGLGLAAVLGIVRGHRGAIKVYSEPGEGTSFKILLPACEQPAVIAPATLEAGEPFEGSGAILVADDEAVVRRVSRRCLERLGFSVLVARDGREAIEVFREHADAIAAVLLDMTMPCFSGEEVFRRLRQIDPGVRVILASGFNEHDAMSRFGASGLAGFLQKPFRPLDLSAALRRALGDPPPPAERRASA